MHSQGGRKQFWQVVGCFRYYNGLWPFKEPEYIPDIRNVCGIKISWGEDEITEKKLKGLLQK